MFVEVEGHGRIYAIADEDMERENDEKTSAVHFVRFEFGDAARCRARGRERQAGLRPQQLPGAREHRAGDAGEPGRRLELGARALGARRRAVCPVPADVTGPSGFPALLASGGLSLKLASLRQSRALIRLPLRCSAVPQPRGQQHARCGHGVGAAVELLFEHRLDLRARHRLHDQAVAEGLHAEDLAVADVAVDGRRPVKKGAEAPFVQWSCSQRPKERPPPPPP